MDESKDHVLQVELKMDTERNGNAVKLEVPKEEFKDGVIKMEYGTDPTINLAKKESDIILQVQFKTEDIQVRWSSSSFCFVLTVSQAKTESETSIEPKTDQEDILMSYPMETGIKRNSLEPVSVRVTRLSQFRVNL